MVAAAFYNCCCTGITDTETFSRNTVNKCFTACCTIQGNITNNNIFIFFVSSACLWVNNQLTA